MIHHSVPHVLQVTTVTIMDLQMCRVHVCKAIIALKVCISSITQLDDSSQCTPCTAVYYCYNNGLTDVQGPCMQGHYCPEGMYI